MRYYYQAGAIAVCFCSYGGLISRDHPILDLIYECIQKYISVGTYVFANILTNFYICFTPILLKKTELQIKKKYTY